MTLKELAKEASAMNPDAILARKIAAEEMFAKLRKRKRVAPPQLYTSPINLPEAQSGQLKLTHRILNGETPVIGMRQALLRGVRPCMAKVENLRIHELSEEKVGVWMTDLPEELEQIAATLRDLPPWGHVLVGGLGLGILATVLRNHPAVDSVTVVENSLDVVKLCKPRGVRVVVADIGEFLKSCRKEFDCFYLDTWQGTNEGTWWHTVMPLRRTIANRWGKKPVWCWAEDIMRGQCESAAVLQCGQYWYYRALPAGMSERQVLRFFDGVGLPWWENRYGRGFGGKA